MSGALPFAIIGPLVGQQQRAQQRGGAVGCLEFNRLGRDEVVASMLRGCQNGLHAAIGGAQRHARRRHERRIRVHIRLRIRRTEVRAVRAVLFRDAMEVLAIESDREDVCLPPVAFVGSEVDHSCCFVDGVDAFDLPVAMGQLRHLLGFGCQRILLIELVEVNVVVAVAPARPEEAVTRRQQFNITAS